MIKVELEYMQRISQGDIVKNIEYIEYAVEKEGIIEISKIEFPLVVVLTQDCDLEQDFNNRNKRSKNQDKYLFSVIVAPLYNVEQVYEGTHLNEIDLNMGIINSNPKKTENKYLKTNRIPRYHYLEFPEDVPIVPSVIDFKHYFTINIQYLFSIKKNNFMCKVCDLYREDISHRFSCFLSRIGLPNR